MWGNTYLTGSIPVYIYIDNSIDRYYEKPGFIYYVAGFGISQGGASLFWNATSFISII